MRYWGNEINEDDKLFLVPASPSVVVCFLWEPRPDCPGNEKKNFRLGLLSMGPTMGDGYTDIEDAAYYFLGTYMGHMEISAEQYGQIRLDTSVWIWKTEEILNTLMPIMRGHRVANKVLPDHINQFYASLGFDEFHASRHSYLQKHGRLPGMVEGKSEKKASSSN